MKGNTGKQGNNHRVLNTVLLFFIVIQILILLSTLMRIRALQQQAKEIKEAATVANTRLYNLDYPTLLESTNKLNYYREVKQAVYIHDGDMYELKGINYNYIGQPKGNWLHTVELNANKDSTTLVCSVSVEGTELEGLLASLVGNYLPISANEVLEIVHNDDSYHFATDKVEISVAKHPHITGADYMQIKVTQKTTSDLWDNERIMYNYGSQPRAKLLQLRMKHRGITETIQLMKNPNSYMGELKSEVEDNFNAVVVTTVKRVGDEGAEIQRKVKLHNTKDKGCEQSDFSTSQIIYTLDLTDKQATLSIKEQHEGDAKLIPSIYKETNEKVGNNIATWSLE